MHWLDYLAPERIDSKDEAMVRHSVFMFIYDFGYF